MSGMSCRYISRCIPTSPSPTNCFSYLCLSSLRSSSTSCIQRITSVISFFFLYTTVLFPPSRPYVPTPPACRQRQRNHTRTPTLHLHSVPDQDKAAASSSLTLDNFFFFFTLSPFDLFQSFTRHPQLHTHIDAKSYSVRFSFISSRIYLRIPQSSSQRALNIQNIAAQF